MSEEGIGGEEEKRVFQIKFFSWFGEVLGSLGEFFTSLKDVE